MIEAALTPIGVIGGIRGVLFANIGGAWFDGQPSATRCSGASGYQFWTNDSEICRPIEGIQTNPAGFPILDADGTCQSRFRAPEQLVSGFRLKDGRASYGVGLETFALGFPMHFDWSWRTLFNKDWEDVAFAAMGGRGVPGAALHLLDRLRLLTGFRALGLKTQGLGFARARSLEPSSPWISLPNQPPTPPPRWSRSFCRTTPIRWDSSSAAR